MAFLSEFLAHSGHPVCTPPDPQAKAIIGCHSPFAPYPQSLQTRYTCFALPEVTRVGGNSLSVGCHCAAISGCTVATSLTPSTRTFPEHAGHPPPVRQAPAIEGRHSPFLPYPHFGQIRAILRLLPQVTSCGDTELAVGSHSSNAGTFLCYRATMPAIPPLEISHGTTTPARLWMFSDFAIFTAVL